MDTVVEKSALDNKKIQNVREDVRRIVIDADWLLKLKILITKVIKEEVEELELRKEIYQQGEKIVDRLLEYFPFIIKLLNKGVDDKLVSELQEELKEKNALLAEVDTKINSIYSKLMKKT